jgi:hypothetical protein
MKILSENPTFQRLPLSTEIGVMYDIITHTHTRARAHAHTNVPKPSSYSRTGNKVNSVWIHALAYHLFCHA